MVHYSLEKLYLYNYFVTIFGQLSLILILYSYSCSSIFCFCWFLTDKMREKEGCHKVVTKELYKCNHSI